MAAVIASQATISGTFSMTKQAIALGLLPRIYPDAGHEVGGISASQFTRWHLDHHAELGSGAGGKIHHPAGKPDPLGIGRDAKAERIHRQVAGGIHRQVEVLDDGAGVGGAPLGDQALRQLAGNRVAAERAGIDVQQFHVFSWSGSHPVRKEFRTEPNL